ncbi:MAG: anti-sigma factor family protein [Myxococcota bacterium]
MNCQEVQDLLHPYLDDELSPEEHARVEAALADCPDCREELREMEAVRAMAREAFVGPAEQADLTGVFDGVMARLEAEGALRTAPAGAAAPGAGAVEPREGLLDRLSRWFGALLTLERPVAALATAAAVAALVGGVWYLQQQEQRAGAPGVQVAEEEPPAMERERPSLPRRGMETEVAASGRNAAQVEAISADAGQVFVDDNADDPDTPMVVWHIVDDNGTEAPEKGL